MPAKRKSRGTRKTAPPQEYPPQGNYYPQQVVKSGPSNLLIILLVAVSFLAAYLFFKLKSVEQNVATNQNQPVAPTRPTSLTIKKPDPSSDHWRGNNNVRYVWVEYSDLECPFCKQVHPSLQQLLTNYGDKIAWVYRQFPLPFHQNAEKEAEASECVAQIGGNDAFWKYIDKIYERTTSNGTGYALTDLGPLAAEIGLDQTAFQQCLGSNKYQATIKSDIDTASTAGVQATPTNLIYDLKTGKNLMIEGALPYDSLKQSLDTFLAQNK